LTEEILLVKDGKSTPSRANSICNLVGKIISSAKLDIDFHRYVQKANATNISMALIKDQQKKLGLPQEIDAPLVNTPHANGEEGHRPS
jgi:hypothetical protein